MRIKFFLCSTIMLLLFQYGCSSESLGSGGGSGSSSCPSVGDLDVEFQTGGLGGGEFCRIGGELTQSATMSALSDGIDWFLDGDITVTAGTLTIMPGVEVFAEGAEEYIYIQNGAAIKAVGTESSPIIFSSNDDGEDGGSEWGGLIIGSGAAEQRIEYVVVAEAGMSVTLDSEVYSANISFVGRHRDTEVRFLQAHASGDDGIALISSVLPNESLLESVLITDAAGDSIYFDNFSGLLKNLLSIQDGLNSSGAGIRGGGVDSNPLIINATLIGQDLNSEIGSSKVGLLFENDFNMPRIANSAIVNFRHGCYQVLSPTDLSALDISSIPDPSFIDGVHCVNEFADLSGVDSAPIGGINLPSDMINIGISDIGLSFYEDTSIVFEKEVANASVTETTAYYINNIGVLENIIDLRQYNNGDGDLSGGASDADDEMVSPLFGEAGIYGGIVRPPFEGLGCRAPSTLPFGSGFYTDDTFTTLVTPELTGDALICGLYLQIPSQSSSFNLRVIGAVESVSDVRFDNWTLDGSF